MAKPRVFISSTYYDLKHLRSAFESFIEQLGFEPVLSEKGNIAYAPDIPLDESCYREVEQVDILVLIVGGRYGSERSFGDSTKEKKDKKEFYDRYDSITREEFRAAIKNNIPTYILIERAVYAEYQTFVKNRDSKEINYAHVDSVNIFKMIDEIIALPRNNPILPFERYHEIEVWLRDQWASLFKELLRRTSSHEQLSSLADQVTQLSETNKTLRKYLESLMTHVDPKSQALITSESKRLKEIKSISRIGRNEFVQFMERQGFGLDEIGEMLSRANTIKELFANISKRAENQGSLKLLDEILERQQSYARKDINDAREILGLNPIPWGQRKKTRPTSND